MKALLTKARDYLRAHPEVVVALGLSLAALGHAIAGQPAEAWSNLVAAASVLGLKVAIGPPAPPPAAAPPKG